MDPISLAQKLIRCPSITPEEAGTLDLLEAVLKPMGFTCHRQKFGAVDNLYARRGTEGKNLCFAGHVDVVPPGDLAAWKHDPFSATIAEESRGQEAEPAHELGTSGVPLASQQASRGTSKKILYGRGTSDMKAAIACWVAALDSLYFAPAPPTDLRDGPNALRATKEGGLLTATNHEPRTTSHSLLITCDEEGPGIDGTKKMLEWMEQKGERIDACLVGEPTSDKALGDIIKIGRRGSVGFTCQITGTQGHVAYPDLAKNPVTQLVNLLHELKSHRLDDGTEFFPPSNLEITTIDVGNPVTNVIPASASAYFNIRFNDQHTGASLTKWVEEICAKHTDHYALDANISAESFFCPPNEFAPLVADAIQSVTGTAPVLTTTGGTSDARFIHHYCKELVECGMSNATAHKVDEHILVEDIENLTAIYTEVIRSF